MSAVTKTTAAELWEKISDDPIETVREYGSDDQADALANIPPHCQPGLARYLLVGLVPGSFLRAVLTGEWNLAEIRADATNKPRMGAYRAFCAACPKEAVGTVNHLRAWSARGGLLQLLPEPGE